MLLHRNNERRKLPEVNASMGFGKRVIKAKSTLDEHCEIFLLSYFYNLRTQGKAKIRKDYRCYD